MACVFQDNQSSNGTFINNKRCSISELEPQEVFSGDVVQFGIPVVENAANSEKVPIWFNRTQLNILMSF